VRDTGSGIAPEQLAGLFQPFTQADSSTTRNFGGTGLGLSIVKNLVELMHGDVGARSTIGAGSTFWFTLPLETPSQPEEVRTERRELPANRILIVDNNASKRRVLVDVLSQGGYQVIASDNAREVIGLLREARQHGSAIEVAVVNFKLAGIDGVALGRAIKSDPLLWQTRLLLLTALNEQNVVPQLECAGFANYLIKPVKPRELLQRVADALSQTTPERPREIPALPAARSTKGRGLALVADDNLVNQKIARRFLERLGCTVISAMDGTEALRICTTEKFDLVLMDIQMPLMDGFEATRRIRALGESNAEMPIIALTADVMPGVVDRCRESGMTEFMSKPLDVTQLRAALDRYLPELPAGTPEALSA